MHKISMAACLAALLAGHPVAAQTVAALQAQPWAQLQTEIARLERETKGVVGVAAVHLPTGRTVLHKADERFGMASTLKLPLALYALGLGDQGKLALTKPVPVARDEMLEPGILYQHFRHPGAMLSPLNAIELSITQSDNGATQFLETRVGGPVAVNKWLESKGLAAIDMGGKSLSQTFSGAGEESSSQPRTATPKAMLALLRGLHDGRLVSAESRDIVLDIMSRSIGERISLRLPVGTRTKHKTGTLFGADGMTVNDVGFIDMPDGGTIAIAVFIKGSPEAVSHSTRDKVIGDISRAIYDVFQFTP